MERSGNAVRTSHQQAGGAGGGYRVEGWGAAEGRDVGRVRIGIWKAGAIHHGFMPPRQTCFFFVFLVVFLFFFCAHLFHDAQSHLVFAWFIWAVWPLGRIVQTVHIKWAMQNKLGGIVCTVNESWECWCLCDADEFRGFAQAAMFASVPRG